MLCNRYCDKAIQDRSGTIMKRISISITLAVLFVTFAILDGNIQIVSAQSAHLSREISCSPVGTICKCLLETVEVVDNGISYCVRSPLNRVTSTPGPNIKATISVSATSSVAITINTLPPTALLCPDGSYAYSGTCDSDPQNKSGGNPQIRATVPAP